MDNKESTLYKCLSKLIGNSYIQTRYSYVRRWSGWSQQNSQYTALHCDVLSVVNLCLFDKMFGLELQFAVNKEYFCVWSDFSLWNITLQVRGNYDHITRKQDVFLCQRAVIRKDTYGMFRRVRNSSIKWV